MEPRRPSLGLAVLVFLIAAVLIGLSVLYWETDIHITLILSAIIAGIIGVAFLKHEYYTVERGIIEGIMTGMQACLILYTVGCLVGTWIVSGVVPSMIYYGLSILSPSIFLFATLIICSIVSLSTGTSWGTAGTVGIALLGIGMGLGVPAPLTAGVIISGGYFGDKLSPLSDTTNLAPAVAGTDLFQHIRGMLWTTVPTYTIVIVITLAIGFKYAGGTIDAANIQAIQELMKAEFWVNPLTLIAPISVIALSGMGKPAIPSLWFGIFISVIFALFQGVDFGQILDIMQNGYVPELTAEIAGAADVASVSALLLQNGMQIAPELAKQASADLVELMTRGGLQSMNWTISLIICAFTFGATLETCGFLEVILDAVMKPIKSIGGMITAVLISCAVCNLFLGDQYLSIAMPGRMFKPAFDESGLHPRMLSRSLEDSATLVSVLIPWNTCGAYHAGVLGVPTVAYMPYAFFNYLTPIVASIMTYMGFGIFWKGRDGEPVKGGKVRPKELAES